VISFARDVWAALRAGQGLTPFLVFFLYVWVVWLVKALLARRYRPWTAPCPGLRASVIVPVFRESEVLLLRVLERIAANHPAELVVVVDGGDAAMAAVAEPRADRVLRIPRAGKRAAIAAGLRATDPGTDVVVVVDSDTVWRRDTLDQLLRPFADPRVGGVTPRQEIFDAHAHPVRRLAAWIEDIRYHLTVPAQSRFGQVGCLAGRTIAYRRAAFAPAVAALTAQRVLGVRLHIGDDRVLTNVMLRSGWRTVYQSAAVVATDAPGTWPLFWRQQLRWARSSQRETILSLRWLWRRPAAFAAFATDIVTPFAFFAIAALGLARAFAGQPGLVGLPLPAEAALAYAGMLASIGVRQIGHVRRVPRDLAALPLFVLQITFVLVPIRIVGFATMFHQGWGTRRGRRTTRTSPPGSA
jgi:hyaluronan synthase